MTPFEQQLRNLGKRRIRLAGFRDAYFRAHPEALEAPDTRRLILNALRELEQAGIAEFPASGWDESGSPPLPVTMILRHTASERKMRPPQAWLPRIAFAADERHPARLAILEAVNTFLVATRGKKLLVVPTSERSLQIFGDEKRLDNLRKGKVTLFEGRLSLRDLSCYPVAPPLAVERSPGQTRGRPILVLENYDSYESFRCWNREVRAYAAIAYGGGNAFRQSARSLDELIASTKASGTLYVGDLDPAGAAILVGVNDDRREAGHSLVSPHRNLYRWLLANGSRRPLDNGPGSDLAAQLSGVFPFELVRGLLELWKTGQRIPQESFGLEQLYGNEEGTANPDAA